MKHSTRMEINHSDGNSVWQTKERWIQERGGQKNLKNEKHGKRVKQKHMQKNYSTGIPKKKFSNRTKKSQSRNGSSKATE